MDAANKIKDNRTQIMIFQWISQKIYFLTVELVAGGRI